MSTVCLLQARIGSTRLPGKVLADLDGEPMLARIIRRLRRAGTVDRIVVATTTLVDDDAIAALAEANDADCHRGPVDDVLTRLAGALASHPADLVVHATADNPLAAPEFIDRLTGECLKAQADFAFISGIPLGSGVDIYTPQALERLAARAHSPAYREHINAYLFDHPDEFNILRLSPSPGFRHPGLRVTVDTAEDLALIRRLANRLGKPTELIDLADVVRLSIDEPELFNASQNACQQYISEAARRLRQAG